MNNIKKYMRKAGFYAKMKGLKRAGFTTVQIKRYVNNEIIIKIKPGLYRLNEIPVPVKTSIDIIDVSKAIPSGILCLVSALSYYDLTNTTPEEIQIAIPNNYRKPQLAYPPIKVFFFPESHYMKGVEKISTKYGKIKIYAMEKTICDIFRYRNKIGEDIALEALKNYLKRKSADYNKLIRFSAMCGVKTIIKPYIKYAAG